MADYNTLKVAELHAALTARSIPFDKKHKKADLVKLLQENDVPTPAGEAEPATESTPAVNPTDTSEKPAPPQASTDTAPAEALAPPVPAGDSALPPPAPDATSAPSEVDAEIEKRKARAAKFGVPYVEPAAPAVKSQKPAASSKPSGKTPSAPVPAEDPEVLAKRRAKFGIPEPVDKDTKKKNGNTVAQSPSPADPLRAEQARLDEEKRKAREERFKVQSGAESTGAKRTADESLDGAEPAEKKTKA